MEGVGTTSDLLDSGRKALAGGEWEAARAHFEELLEHEESPEGLEGLGRARSFLDDVDGTFEARERAYRLYRERADARGAARVALYLAEDSLVFRNEPAVFNGWTERARRLLEDEPIGPEHAFLALRDAFFAFMASGDPDLARRHAADAIELARRFDLFDFEMLALSIDGVSLVAEGDVTEGMRRLDEATAAATGGEMQDVELIGRTCCFMIYGCERTRDFERAAQWCLRAQEFCQRSGLRSLFGVCRAHYATVLTARGEWTKAEQEFLGAEEALAPRPLYLPVGTARLGELRRRQGRLDEAEELFERVAFHPEAQLGLANLALDRGDPALARDLTERYLRQIAERDRTQRALGMEVLVRAAVALDDLGEARRAAAELRLLAGDIGTPLLRAAAAQAEGLVAGASGDAEAERHLLEDAIDLYERSGLPFEGAEARLMLAEAHLRAGRIDRAVEQAGKASERFDQLDAAHARERAASILRSLGVAPGGVAPLTPREIEVLRLVARGLVDREIGRTLTLSEHTVHRHVSNILTKFDVPSRAAAVARAVSDELI